MRILVTGGAGVIGTNLCKRLLNEGEEVICLDNFSSGRKENVKEFMNNERFQLIEKDVIEPIDIEVDQIYNLACPASPPYYQKDPVHTTCTCVEGALRMLDLAVKNNAKILLSSTSEIYGEPLEHPQKESYRGNVNSIGIRSCYDEGKRMAESLFFDYWRCYGARIKVVRIFNTYGPGMQADDGRVISNFIIQALQGKNLTVFGKGEQTRSFCYVDDLVEGLIRMMNTTDEITGPVNLGNPAERTVLSLAEEVIKMTGSKAKIVYKKIPADDPSRRCPDITLAKTLLNWKPTVALEEGLQKTIEWFSNK